MNKIYQIYQVSDSTGETLDRIFSAIKAQFSNFNCKTIHYSFTRTKNQIDKIISKSKTEEDVIILYTIVDENLAKYLTEQTKKNNIPCFEVLGSLITDFSKLLKQKASHKPSGQHVLDDEYYKRIEAVQFTMSHDDGKKVSDIDKSDITILDSKTKLQEYSLKNYKKLPFYRFLSTSGPRHKPTYKISVSISGSKQFIGLGGSKQQAEQDAAYKLLKDININ